MLRKLFSVILLVILGQELYAQTADDWVKSANEKNDRGDREGAIADCNKALQLNPKSAWALNVRGVVKNELGRHEDAIADYDQSVALDPKYVYPYCNRGNAKLDLGRYTDAIADYDQAVALDPKYAIAYNNRGFTKYKLEKYAEAIADYDQAIALDPKYAMAYTNCGEAKYKLGQYADAILEYDQAIASDPKNVAAYTGRGRAKGHLGRDAESLSDFDQAIVLAPQVASAYSARGVSKCNLGKYREAISDYNQAVALNPKYEIAYNNRGYAYYKLGGARENYQQAIADYDKSIELGGASYLPYYKYRDDALKALNDHPAVVPQQAIILLNWIKPGESDLREDVYDTQSGTLPVWVRISSSNPVMASNIRLLLNGENAPGDKATIVDLREIKASKSFGNSPLYQYDYKTTVILPEGTNTIQVRYNNEKTGELKVNYQASGLNLYVLTIGTHNSNLDYPEKDATDMAAMFSNQGAAGKIFHKVSIHRLTGMEATAGNMSDQLSAIAQQPFTGNDVLLVFISSHGFIKNGQLQITGSDFKTTQLNQTSLNFNDDVIGKLNSVNCKKFILLDACHSGNATGDREALSVNVSKAIEDLKNAANDFTIITSSSEDEKSWEDKAWQNGAFTRAMKEALQDGRADANNDHIITVDELYTYISKRVPAIVLQVKNEQQHPKMHNLKGDVPIYVY